MKNDICFADIDKKVITFIRLFRKFSHKEVYKKKIIWHPSSLEDFKTTKNIITLISKPNKKIFG